MSTDFCDAGPAKVFGSADAEAGAIVGVGPAARVGWSRARGSQRWGPQRRRAFRDVGQPLRIL